MHVSKVEPEALLIDGDRAATFSRLTGVLCGTGRIISYRTRRNSCSSATR